MSDDPSSAAPSRPAPWRGRPRVEKPRDAWVHIRVTADERAALEAAAERAEMPLGPYVVSAALNAPQRRAARRISVDRLALAQALGWLGKAGSNLNQIARALNSGGDRPAAEIADAISAIRDAGLAISATLRGRRP